MEMDRLFFKYNCDKDDTCNHATLSQCLSTECWYVRNLSDECVKALHKKDKHSTCSGEYLFGTTEGENGADFYMECSCLCHQDKYYSPLSGQWL